MLTSLYSTKTLINEAFCEKKVKKNSNHLFNLRDDLTGIEWNFGVVGGLVVVERDGTRAQIRLGCRTSIILEKKRKLF